MFVEHFLDWEKKNPTMIQSSFRRLLFNSLKLVTSTLENRNNLLTFLTVMVHFPHMLSFRSVAGCTCTEGCLCLCLSLCDIQDEEADKPWSVSFFA